MMRQSGRVFPTAHIVEAGKFSLARVEAVRRIHRNNKPCLAMFSVFAEIGPDIKAKSPFKPTFAIELANGYNGYLPTPEQHKLGGYETWRARSSYLEVDAAPKIVELFARWR